MSAETKLNKAQIAALRQLALTNANSTAKATLYLSDRELPTVGAVFMQLVDLGYAQETHIHAGWVKIAITKKGRKKLAEVQSDT